MKGDRMKMIHLVVGIVVATVLLGSVMVPVINTSNFTKVDRTVLSNEGTPLIKGDVNGEYTIQWDSALPGMVKVNGNVTTVYFAAGSDATVSPESKEVTTDLTYGDLPIPTRTGYTFDGWYTDTNYTTEVTENTIVTSKSDIVLYAKWVANEYTITFDADGGSVSPATKTVTFGQAYGELPTPTYTGHIFGGWFNDDNEVITASNIVDVADDQTLTAVWTLEKYTVSFTTDGHGTVDVQSLQVDYGTSYTVSSNTIVIGETTITATATSPYVFDHWTPGTSGTITESTTFMAYFNDPPVTITFTAQSPGSVSSASIADVPRGTQYVVADNVVTITGFTPVTASLPDGYYMTGWNIAQGVGTISDAMTFTAQYEVIEIAQLAGTDYTTWALTTDGKLFGCGYNNNGQQGDGTTTNVTTFTQRLSGETIAMVSCSNNATWAVTTDGKLFGCGSNYYGQQGNDTVRDNITTFTQRLSGETIASVYCSNSTTWAITTDGKLFGCGNNDGGMLGDSTGGNSYAKTFVQRLSGETIASVSCSTDTTWAVTTDGKLFGCGYGNLGQQGDGTTTNVTTFTQRLSGETIASVITTGNTTWAVTTDGKLFGCGTDGYQNQSNGSATGNVTTFTQHLETETVAQISVTNKTTWAVTTDGKLFGCGNNTNGQQSSGGTTTVDTFTQRLSGETVASVYCSENTTWAVTTDGKLFGCGQNNNSQQGGGTTTNVTSFTQRGPPGSVNIPVTPQIINLTPIINPNLPFNPVPITPMSVTPADIVSTDYTFLAGGSDWLLCTVSVGVDQYALALYYAGLDEPLLWDQDVTMVFSNGSMTVENNGQSYTLEYTSIFFKGNGDYVLMSDSAYVWDDTEILGYSIPTTTIGIEVIGDISSLEGVSIADDTVTFGDVSVTVGDTDYDHVKTISELGIIYNTDQSAACTSVIVPKSVVITNVVENDAVNSILSVMPVLIIVALIGVVAAVVLVRSRA